MSAPEQRILPGSKRVLVLRRRGALGACIRPGVVSEAITREGFRPEWLAGVSIGAVNAAIVAGNAPEKSVDALRSFWEEVSASLPLHLPFGNDQLRSAISEASAAWVASFDVAGFFRPRFPPPFLLPAGVRGATSFYDTSPLRATLEGLVDFDRINAKETRLSIGAVNVKTGILHYFDNTKQKIGPEHVMASGALPPGFPAVEVDGEFYWDGGVVSNTPLEFVLEEDRHEDLTIFQVDLFNAAGSLPETILDTMEREKDIHYASRTRHNTAHAVETRRARVALKALLDSLPEEYRNNPNADFLATLAREHRVAVVQLVYNNKPYEGSSKDYEFSRQAMTEHWEAGVAAVEHCISQHRHKLSCRPESAMDMYEAHQQEDVTT